MITKSTLQFFAALKENNNREWFQENRKKYEAAKAEMESVVAKILPGLIKADPSIGMLAPKDCMFRINRDIRFSADKSPYKTNMGAFMARGGRKSRFPGYYLHIEPGACFLAGGVYAPEPGDLKSIRSEIYFNSAEFLKIINGRTFKSQFGTLADWGKMVRPPKDFPADFPHIDLLKYKSYSVAQGLTDKQVTSPGFPEYALTVYKAMRPFHAFLTRAIELEA